MQFQSENNLKKPFADSDSGVINTTSIVDPGMWPVREKMKAFGDKEVGFIVNTINSFTSAIRVDPAQKLSLQ